jgi:hypothetical protein
MILSGGRTHDVTHSMAQRFFVARSRNKAIPERCAPRGCADTSSATVGNLATWQGALLNDVTYLAAQAYNTSLQSSPYSAEVTFTVGFVPLPTLATLTCIGGSAHVGHGHKHQLRRDAGARAPWHWNGVAATPRSWSTTSPLAPCRSARRRAASTGTIDVRGTGRTELRWRARCRQRRGRNGF